MVIRISILTAFLLLFFAPMQAQEITEESLAREQALIEANREKLLGNYDKAIEILRELHRKMSDNAAVAFELGRLYYVTDDVEESIRFLKMATESDVTNEWYPKFLSDIYQEEGRNEDAAALYEILIGRDAENPEFYFKRAFFLARNQQFGEALEVYETLEKLQGISEELARRKHALYLGTGDIRKATKTLEDLVTAFPNVLPYKHLLASFLESQGNETAARKVYADILTISPDDPKAQLAMSNTGAAQNDETAYLRSLQAVFQRHDADIDLKISKIFPAINKVTATGDQALADEVIVLTEILETVHSGNAKGYAASGDMYYNSGRPVEAIAKYMKAVDIDKGIFPVRQQLLQALYETGDFENLEEQANETLDLYPNKAIVQYYLALATDGQGKYENALDALSLAALMAGRDNNLLAEVKALQGQVLVNDGDQSAAKTAFEEALELSPNAPEVNARYAMYLLAKGQEENAMEHALVAASQVTYQPYYAMGVAKIYFAIADYDNANKAIQTALQNSGQQHPESLELAGDIQFMLKNTEQAVQFWQKARQAAGPNQQLDQKIANRSL